jgi:hypothetical protein
LRSIVNRRRRLIVTALLAAALAAGLADSAGTGAAAEVVELRVPGRFFNAPATVTVVVVVEPDAANRSLRVEMDSDRMFRASVRALEGASAKRVHEIAFKEMPQGHYTVQAEVLDAAAVRGTAKLDVDILGSPGEPR